MPLAKNTLPRGILPQLQLVGGILLNSDVAVSNTSNFIGSGLDCGSVQRGGIQVLPPLLLLPLSPVLLPLPLILPALMRLPRPRP